MLTQYIHVLCTVNFHSPATVKTTSMPFSPIAEEPSPQYQLTTPPPESTPTTTVSPTVTSTSTTAQTSQASLEPVGTPDVEAVFPVVPEVQFNGKKKEEGEEVIETKETRGGGETHCWMVCEREGRESRVPKNLPI